MKYIKILFLFYFFTIIFSTSVLACFVEPYHIREGIESDDGLWLIRRYESMNPYYAKDLIIICVQEMEIPDIKNFNDRYYKTSGDLCINGSFNKEIITSVKLNGKDVDFSFIDISNSNKSYYQIFAVYGKRTRTITAMKVQTGPLFNGISNYLKINNHNFRLMYSEGVRPFWTLALIGIIFGFVSLFIKNKSFKKRVIFFSLLFSFLSFLIIKFDRKQICYSCESPGFIFIGVFLLIFFAIIIRDYLKNSYEKEYNNKSHKIIYGIVLMIFILLSWFISQLCLIS